MAIRLKLRHKLIAFAVLLAILPLLVAGQRLVDIARDELKSAANEELAVTARQLRNKIDNIYYNVWLAPLTLIRNAVDDPQLGIKQKISLMTQGLADLPGIVALQITVEGAAVPVVVTQQRFFRHLQSAGLDALTVLRVSDERVAAYRSGDSQRAADVTHIAKTDDWLATIALPMQAPAGAGAGAMTMLARVDMQRLSEIVKNHPFNQTGEITLVDADGVAVLGPTPTGLDQRGIVTRAITVLGSKSRAITVEPYTRTDGAAYLGAFSFPKAFNWALVVEMSEHDAYLAVDKMLDSLYLWVAIGLAVAVFGAIVFAWRMSRPILAIGDAAVAVAKGDFKVRVTTVHSRDEIGELAGRVNDMIAQLSERFHLLKFVSTGTLDAIKGAQGEAIELGGESRRVALLFADIRGYTAFSEDKDPKVVVDVLNYYFQSLADIVTAHHGDIDKFVGDQIMAVFLGDDMAYNAAACALDFQSAMVEIGERYPDADLEIGIGIHTGDVIMGAMGSKNRMDYTVLGDNVNLAARLCSHASEKQNLISDPLYEAVRDGKAFRFVSLDPIRVKGKSHPIRVHAVERVESHASGPDDATNQPNMPTGMS